MISVVIPLYNKEEYILRAVRSVLAQTFQQFELIIVNDGSTDNSVAKVEELHAPQIRIIHQANAGVSAARNRGIEESQYQYIAFLDGDDEWLENHLEVIVGLMKQYSICDLFATSYYFVKGDLPPTLPIVPNSFVFCGKDGIIENYFELASGADFPLHMSSFVVRKSLIQSIGGFPVGIPSGEDIITIARLHALTLFAYSKLPTSFYYLISEGKNARPVELFKPLDALFDALLKEAAHRKGVRRFVSAWHKRRMVGALFAHQYLLALQQFLKAFSIYPLQKKLYTSLLLTFLSIATGRDLYSLNQQLSKLKKHK